MTPIPKMLQGPLGPEPPPPNTPTTLSNTPDFDPNTVTLWRGVVTDSTGNRGLQSKTYAHNLTTEKIEKVEGASQPTKYEIERVRVETLGQMKSLLHDLHKQRDRYLSLAILPRSRGAKATGRKGQYGPTVNARTHWILFDIDGYDGCTALQPTHEDLRKVADTILPECFHGVSFTARLSSSQGVKRGTGEDEYKLCAHFFFRLKTPLRSRGEGLRFDPYSRQDLIKAELANPASAMLRADDGKPLFDRQGHAWAQPIYTADATNRGGRTRSARPKLTQRFFIVQGQCDEADNPIPQNPSKKDRAQTSIQYLDGGSTGTAGRTPNTKAYSAAVCAAARPSSPRTNPTPTNRPQRRQSAPCAPRFFLSRTTLNRVADQLPTATDRLNWWGIGSLFKAWNEDGPHGLDAFIRYTERCSKRKESRDHAQVTSAWEHGNMGYHFGPEIARSVLEKCIQRQDFSAIPRRNQNVIQAPEKVDAPNSSPEPKLDPYAPRVVVDEDGCHHVTLSPLELADLDADKMCMMKGEPLPRRDFSDLADQSAGANPDDMFDDGRPRLVFGTKGTSTPIMRRCEKECAEYDFGDFHRRYTALREQASNTSDLREREAICAELWCVAVLGQYELTLDFSEDPHGKGNMLAAIEHADGLLAGWDSWGETSSSQIPLDSSPTPQPIETPAPQHQLDDETAPNTSTNTNPFKLKERIR